MPPGTHEAEKMGRPDAQLQRKQAHSGLKLDSSMQAV